jgi:hypothetical protein
LPNEIAATSSLSLLFLANLLLFLAIRRAAYVRAHRCPEVTEDDTPPVQIAEEIVAVIDLMMDRLDKLADAMGVNGSDDDDDERQSDDRRGHRLSAGA